MTWWRLYRHFLNKVVSKSDKARRVKERWKRRKQQRWDPEEVESLLLIKTLLTKLPRLCENIKGHSVKERRKNKRGKGHESRQKPFNARQRGVIKRAMEREVQTWLEWCNNGRVQHKSSQQSVHNQHNYGEHTEWRCTCVQVCTRPCGCSLDAGVLYCARLDLNLFIE